MLKFVMLLISNSIKDFTFFTIILNSVSLLNIDNLISIFNYKIKNKDIYLEYIKLENINKIKFINTYWNNGDKTLTIPKKYALAYITYLKAKAQIENITIQQYYEKYNDLIILTNDTREYIEKVISYPTYLIDKYCDSLQKYKDINVLDKLPSTELKFATLNMYVNRGQLDDSLLDNLFNNYIYKFNINDPRVNYNISVLWSNMIANKKYRFNSSMEKIILEYNYTFVVNVLLQNDVSLLKHFLSINNFYIIYISYLEIFISRIYSDKLDNLIGFVEDVFLVKNSKVMIA